MVLLLQAGHLLGRYISVFSLMVIGGFAIGPAIGGAVLAFLTQRRLVGRRPRRGSDQRALSPRWRSYPRQAASRDWVKGPARQPYA